MEDSATNIVYQLNSNQSDKKPDFFEFKSIMHALKGEKANSNLNEDIIDCKEIGHFLNNSSKEKVSKIIHALFSKLFNACKNNQGGSTLIVALYYLNEKGKWTLAFGSIGDSSAFVVKCDTQLNAEECTLINQHHSVENENEVKRLFLLGKHTIQNKRLNGVLQPLRTIGDKLVTQKDPQLSLPDIYHIEIEHPEQTYLLLASDGYTDEARGEMQGFNVTLGTEYEILKAFNGTQKTFDEAKKKPNISLHQLTENLFSAAVAPNTAPPDDTTLGVMAFGNKSFLAYLGDGHGATKKKTDAISKNPTIQTISAEIFNFFYDLNKTEQLPSPTALCYPVHSWLDLYSPLRLNSTILRTLIFFCTYKDKTKERTCSKILKAISLFYIKPKKNYHSLFSNFFLISKKSTGKFKEFYTALETAAHLQRLDPVNKFLSESNIPNDFTVQLYNIFKKNFLIICNALNLDSVSEFHEVKEIFSLSCEHTIDLINIIPKIAELTSQKILLSSKSASNTASFFKTVPMFLKVYSQSSPALLSKPSHADLKYIKTQLNTILDQFLQVPLTQSIANLEGLADKLHLKANLLTPPNMDSDIDVSCISF